MLREKEMTKEKTDPKTIEKDDVLSFNQYVKVVKNKQTRIGVHRIDVVNLDTGHEFYIEGNQLIQESISADRYTDNKILIREKIAEILVRSFNRPFSVNFVKKDGTNRTIRARLVSSEHLMGRSMVEDLDIDIYNSRLRQVDHRTINWLIVDGIKYTAKK